MLFSHFQIVYYHCTKYHLSSISLSGHMGCGLNDPPGHTATLKIMGLIGLTYINFLRLIGAVFALFTNDFSTTDIKLFKSGRALCNLFIKI